MNEKKFNNKIVNPVRNRGSLRALAISDGIKILKNGGVGIMPTDTLYGLVGSAFSKKAVEKIYQLKKRNPKKPLIVLISSISDLKKFKIKINAKQAKILEEFWPGKTSIILECHSSKFKYLHRGTKSLAFRIPKKKSLIEILKKTGPLVAPSANPEGLKPAENIMQAKKYFSSSPPPSPLLRKGKNEKILPWGEDLGGVDFYLSEGTLKSKPSVLVRLNKKGEIETLRGKLK